MSVARQKCCRFSLPPSMEEPPLIATSINIPVSQAMMDNIIRGKTPEQRYSFLLSLRRDEIPDEGAFISDFVPSLKAMCIATMANTKRLRSKQVARIDPLLLELYNTEVNMCERPCSVWTGETVSAHTYFKGDWTAYGMLLIKKRTRLTRSGPHYHIKKQCVSCWIRDPEPCVPY